MPILYGEKQAPLTIISWGSMKAPILQALKDSPAKFNYLHFNHIWPLDNAKVKNTITSSKKTLLVENNSTAQFGSLLTMVTGVEFENKLLKYSGRPVYPEEILDRIKNI